jgi:hypothetical protein
MTFNNQKSKFNEGDRVILTLPLKFPTPKVGTISSIGILGSKLSDFIFVYQVVCDDGTSYTITNEEVLTKKL